MSTLPIRFKGNARKVNLAANDAVPLQDGYSDEDQYFELSDLVGLIETLLADRLLSEEDRAKIDTPAPAIGIQRRYYRGATPPAVDTSNANPGPGWSTTLAGGTDAVWEIMASFNNGVFVPPWSAPVKISGEKGIDGLDGDDGTPGNQYFFQNDAPGAGGRRVNDVWWDKDDLYKQYRWDGTQWVPSFQPLVLIDANGNVTGLQRAGEVGKPFQILASVFQIWDGVSASAPFEVIDGVTYIKEAVIRQVAAAKIIGGIIEGQEIILSGSGAKIRSSDFVTGVSGWQISGGGAEFPALIVRAGNIEANAVTRRYGNKFPNTGLLSAGVSHEIASSNVTMVSGDTAQITISLGYASDTATPFPTDAELYLKRSDGTMVDFIGWTVQQGKCEIINYTWIDTTPTTRYSIEMKNVGGKAEARGTNLSVIIYRK